MGRRKSISGKFIGAAVVLTASAIIAHTASAQVTGTVNGSVDANFSSSTDNDGDTTYSFSDVSGGLTVDLPVVPATANIGTDYWTTPTDWGGTSVQLIAGDTYHFGQYVAGALDNAIGAVFDIPSEAQTLEQLGPTENTIGWTWTGSYGGVSFPVSAGANVTYDVYIPTGTNMTMDQQSVIIHSLFVYPGATLQANTYLGNQTFIVRTDFYNQGTVQDLGGTVQGDFTNYANASANVTGPLSVQGTFTNYGTLSVESAGALNLSQDTTNEGEIDFYDGSINLSGTFTNSGSFISHSTGTSMIGVTFNNTGTVEVDSGTLNFHEGFESTNGDFVCNNGATLQVQGSFVLSGVNKLSGTGTLEVAPGGAGQLSGDSNQGGTLDAAAGTTVLLDGGAFGGNLTFTGAGSFQWTNGVIGGGEVTNSSPNFTIIGSSNGPTIVPGSTLNNTATITESGAIGSSMVMDGSYNSDLGAATLNNQADAVYNLQGDVGISTGQSNPINIINNAGLFEKTAGAGTSTVGVTFNNTGTVEVDSGTLNFHEGFESTNGDFVCNNGATLQVQGSFVLSGVNKLSGTGTLEVAPGGAGQLSGDSNQGGTLDAAAGTTVLLDGGAFGGNLTFTGAGSFQWTNGVIGGGEVTNSSPNFTIIGSSNGPTIVPGSTLNNTATITESGAIGSSMVMDGSYNSDLGAATLNNQADAVYNLQGDVGISTGQSNPINIINNAGLFEKTAGAGTSTVGVTFNNTGTVEVDIGTLLFTNGGLNNAGLINIRGGTLIADDGIGGSSILTQIQSGYDNGHWNGTTGITSTLAATRPGTAIGYSINGNSVILTFTWLGDANLDGIVDANDLAMISPAGTTWQTGDFNYDGIVNADDYALFMLGAAYGSVNISTTVPEPGVVGLMGVVAVLGTRHRRRCGAGPALST